MHLGERLLALGLEQQKLCLLTVGGDQIPDFPVLLEGVHQPLQDQSIRFVDQQERVG
ncbi:MAG: hypothetical protein WAT23_10170 [Chromatiaceae bacterium]